MIAETMADEIGADIIELKTTKKLANSKGMMKYIWGGMKAMMKSEPDLQKIDKEISDYDLLIIGTPIWAWTVAPPIRTFLKKSTLKNKQLAFFCCSGGDKGKVFSEMASLSNGAEILGERDFIEPLRHNKTEQVKSARNWAQDILKGVQ